MARDSWMTQIHNEPDQRMTKDLDLAVFITDTAAYEVLQTWLVEQEGFILTKSSSFCLIYPLATAAGRVVVDLMPFGAIADEAGDVYLTGQGGERISTVGFPEVLAEAVTVGTPTGQQWRVVTLPGIVVLKLVAWQDRPEMRGKDALDVWNLLEVYSDLVLDEVYTTHADLLSENETTDTIDLLLVGARVLGRQVRQLLADRPVQVRLLTLLAKELKLGEQSQLARAMSRPGTAIAICLAALAALRAGIEDAWPLTLPSAD